MTQYLDSSALLAVLMDEPTAERVGAVLASDRSWVTARHTAVEVRRTIARSLAPDRVDAARQVFARYWEQVQVVELDEITCSLAAEAAESTGVRTLDALHLGAAQRAAGSGITVVTLDRRLADGARSLGMAVRGVEA